MSLNFVQQEKTRGTCLSASFTPDDMILCRTSERLELRNCDDLSLVKFAAHQDSTSEPIVWEDVHEKPQTTHEDRSSTGHQIDYIDTTTTTPAIDSNKNLLHKVNDSGQIEKTFNLAGLVSEPQEAIFIDDENVLITDKADGGTMTRFNMVGDKLQFLWTCKDIGIRMCKNGATGQIYCCGDYGGSSANKITVVISSDGES